MGWDISFHAYGDHFRPSLVSCSFAYAIEPDGIATTVRHKDQQVHYGHAKLVLPAAASSEDRAIVALCKYAADWLPALKQAGATEFTLWVIRDCHEQCNEELIPEELQLIASLGCALCYSAYQTEPSNEHA